MSGRGRMRVRRVEKANRVNRDKDRTERKGKEGKSAGEDFLDRSFLFWAAGAVVGCACRFSGKILPSLRFFTP